jgi:hypothetical protein
MAGPVCMGGAWGGCVTAACKGYTRAVGTHMHLSHAPVTCIRHMHLLVLTCICRPLQPVLQTPVAQKSSLAWLTHNL